ncbi:MAG: FkbM family methyltransferase [Bacteroidales bacterium]|nr:FkbM family methyltransferase [Bacteroidales bacterium]MDD4361406.1 FkbM family methyltransferase [Bacteroidales bacterium]
MNLTSVYRQLFPEKIRVFFYTHLLHQILEYKRNYPHIKKVLGYYKNQAHIPEEFENYLRYFRKHRFNMSSFRLIFLSDFVEKYQKLPVETGFDATNNMYYVLHKGKKLYWPEGFNSTTIAGDYRRLMLEQDKDSPHCYWESPSVFKDQVLFDVGAAEGLITLDHIEDLKHAVLFECSTEWIKALRLTFKPYAEKISIVEKYITGTTDEQKNTLTLDDYIQQTGFAAGLIKMDIEGFEEEALEGSRRFLTSSNPKLAICTYHKAEAEQNIRSIVTRFGYSTSTTKGHICYVHSNEHFFRKGVLRAEKN